MNAERLSVAADGHLRSKELVPVPFMAPRLQGTLLPGGKVKVGLWGSGDLADIAVTPLVGPFVYHPNGVVGANGGLFVATTAPALLLKGCRLLRITPYRRCAKWESQPHAAIRLRRGDRQTMKQPWGCLVAEQRGEDVLLAVGVDEPETELGLKLSATQVEEEASAYAARCDALPQADPLLRSMVVYGAHAALASVRRDRCGGFAGLAAGDAYCAPARTYYRDSYWTLQLLLQIAPQVAGEEIAVLARGIVDDGTAPSGVILSGVGQGEAWARFLQRNPAEAAAHRRPTDWWSDHFDSPLFFVLAVRDYVRATADGATVDRYWPLLKAVFAHYGRLAAAGNGLPLKPRNDRDWADNVFRGGAVSYDLGLWIGMLDAMTEFARTRDPALGERAGMLAARGREAIEQRLWLAAGWYADYTDGDFVEDHLTLDSLTLLRFGAVGDARAARVLAAMRRRLECRHNDRQPWGDWGTMCAYPPFQRHDDLRGKTAFSFRYHNCADWPYLDGLYAEERLRRGLSGWRHPLTQWWRSCLANGWCAPVEYFSPPYGRGSLLQGWSSMPAAVALAYRRKVLQKDNDESA